MGGDINLQDSRGWTALHHAVKQNDIDKVRFLKSHGALNIRNNDGLIPYQMTDNRDIKLILR